MRPTSPIGRPFLRCALWLATTSLTLSAALPARAQTAVPGAEASGSDLAGQPNTNPPPVAGSLAAIAGSVSFHAAGETQWSPATLNYPVTNGEGFWTEPQASATIDIADDRLVLDESTELDVTALDQSQFVMTAAQGAIFVQLNSLAQGQTLTVNTPRGTVQISQAGEYEIVAGDTNDATAVTVVEGAAHISGTNLTLDVGPNQTATVTGSDNFEGSVGAYQEDAFLATQLQLARKQPREEVPPGARYMTGAAELASYGSFSQTSQYGQVWYPNSVPANWAPYRDGHWSYVQPWGWTWVDNAPWGFAPFHYGRWAEIDNRWGWIPGGGQAAYAEGSYPVYSPALVAFIGIGAAGLGFAGGEFAAGGIAPAWIPLGFHEPYYPWYHCRDDYFGRINAYYGVPRTIIELGPTYINSVNFHQTNIFINRRAATVVPAAAFARGESVVAMGRPVPERSFAEARPFAGRLPVRPTAFTPHLTPEVARRFHIPAPAHPVHVAAGPRIMPIAPGNRAVPVLRHAALPQNIHHVPAAPFARSLEQRPGATPPLPAEARGSAHTALPGHGEGPLSSEMRGPVPPPSNHGMPALRAPGARPDSLAHPDQAASHTDRPAPDRERPGSEPGRLPPSRPEGTRPELRRPDMARPPVEDRSATRPLLTPRSAAPRPDSSRGETPRPAARAVGHDAPRSDIRPEASRPEATRREVEHHEVPRPDIRPDAPRPEATRREVEHHEAPRPEIRAASPPKAPHPVAHEEAPHPAAHPAPRPEDKPHKQAH